MCTSASYVREKSTLSLSNGDPNSVVVLYFADGRAYSLSRALLDSATESPSLSLLGASSHGVSVAAATLYDDDAATFATLARFEAGAALDLSGIRAALSASAASRWRVPMLFSACMAAPEADPTSGDLQTIAAWLSVHAHSILPLSGRLRKLLARRVALTMPHILAASARCERCGNAGKLDQACTMCARLPDRSSVWDALRSARLLRRCVSDAARVAGPRVEADLRARLSTTNLSELPELPGHCAAAVVRAGNAAPLHSNAMELTMLPAADGVRVRVTTDPEAEKDGVEKMVKIKLQMMAGGCACDLGCARDQPSPLAHWHGEWEHVTKWSDMRSPMGVLLSLPLDAWSKRHDSGCALVVAAQVFDGKGTTPLDSPDSHELGLDAQGVVTICACRKCQLMTSG